MSGQVVFETPVVPIEQSCRLIDDESKTTTKTHPRLGDAFRELVTRSEVESVVRRALSSAKVELVDYHLRAYSEEKIGFLGSHLCLIVLIREPGRSEPLRRSFFVKTLPYDAPGQAAYIEEKGCFRKESAFVEVLMPMLTENYGGEAWTPKCYLVKRNTLVFEDMKFRGFSNSKSKLFDLKTMRAAVACIARFHACSLLAEERLGGMTLKDLCPELLEETEFQRTGRSYEWYTNAVDFAIYMADKLGLDSSQIRSASELVFDICLPSKNKRNVVSHGDLWSSNMLFDGDSENCYLVDFQLIRYAPLAHDLAQLIYLCSTREFRARHEGEVVEHYYTVLRESLAMSGYRGEVPRFEEVERGMEEQRFPAMVTAMIFHPTTLMDGKTAATLVDDPDTYEAYYFRDRVPFAEDVIAKDSVYKAKIEENVREVAEMSRKLDSLPRPT